MQTLASYNIKGGVGKTAAAGNLDSLAASPGRCRPSLPTESPPRPVANSGGRSSSFWEVPDGS